MVVVHRVLDQYNKGVLSHLHHLASHLKIKKKKIDIQNQLLGNLLTQGNANQVSDARVKEVLDNIKDHEIQKRLDELRRDNNNNGDDDKINFKFNGNNDDDEDMDIDDLLRKYDNLRKKSGQKPRRPIPRPRPQKDKHDLFRRYDKLRPKTDESDLFRSFDAPQKPMFRNISPSPPAPLK